MADTAKRARRKTPVDRAALTRLRLEKGWTISELSRQSDVTASHISAVEQGADIRITTLAKLADALGVSLPAVLLPQNGDSE